VVGNWIFDENLRVFMDALAHYSGGSFDDDDWIGLEHDLILRPDQLDRERRVEWPLGANTVVLTYEPGSSVVSFELDADDDLEVRADTLVYVLQLVLAKPDA
jgi:hypothetical protein